MSETVWLSGVLCRDRYKSVRNERSVPVTFFKYATMQDMQRAHVGASRAWQLVRTPDTAKEADYYRTWSWYEWQRLYKLKMPGLGEAFECDLDITNESEGEIE